MKKRLAILSLSVMMTLGLLSANLHPVQENTGYIKQMSDQIGA
ncbi:hypothetical protein [Brevibacillus laterosporus]|uniref:Phosphatase n=1 Tax=Brevibacillus laterosporus TaxID=1465 RepID=A0AAP3DGX4_BRELA|nr:hypothetical protein [Brevibacillus laterosporus]MCR8980602.1 hypothetical protein [Brevibacillus laterosporus]MCZ0807757.1 hypothetical protein [Brevibacillus laterosporus]MCZ0826033.1 hypothetical protein [Brevibacillus laterosporus]MCZ0849800.1 hypothetical protein [Brevibacillus laterosporus]MED2003284.1 hypothetical protein [Brevibacillus laterosporus]